jgi:hypothetical protein
LRRRSATSVGVSFSVDVDLLATDGDEVADCAGVTGALLVGRVRGRDGGLGWRDGVDVPSVAALVGAWLAPARGTKVP